MAELHRVYSAKSKAYGVFNEESELSEALRLQRQGEEEFHAFTRAATVRLKDELAKYPFAGAVWCYLPITAIWRWSICWWRYSTAARACWSTRARSLTAPIIWIFRMRILSPVLT